MSESIIQVENIRKSYGELVAVNGISFNANAERSSACWGRMARARRL